MNLHSQAKLISFFLSPSIHFNNEFFVSCLCLDLEEENIVTDIKPEPSVWRSEEDIALDRTLVFHYDHDRHVVIKEEIPQLPGNQPLPSTAPRRKKPRYGYGAYEDPFPESEEEPEEPLARGSSRKRKNPPPQHELPFNHPAIRKEKGRSINTHDN